MKPRWQIISLTTLLGIFVAQAVDIPLEYEQIDLSISSDLNDYASNTADDNYAFFLCSDLNFTPTTNTTWTSSTHLVTGGNHIFTTAKGYAPVALSFSGGKSTVFEQPSSITFDTFNNMNVSNQIMGAIDLGASGKLYIRNINDGIDNPEAADVVFSNNINESSGGVIYANGKKTLIEVTGNGDVLFNENRAPRYSNGGVINSKGAIVIRDNSSISFRGSFADYDGGAIYSTGTIDIHNNGAVSFIENSAGYSGSWGGAICSVAPSSAAICIQNNGAVYFKKNSSNHVGGAIMTHGTMLDISNNADVIFSENFAATRGGAIYSSGAIIIIGNDSVTFEKNYDNNQLRSIFMSTDSIDDNLILAAKREGYIFFYDSVYMDSYHEIFVSLNADYQDAKGVTQKATGDIVFSGKYTEEHLKEIKGGTAGTATEIANSRTSELLNTVNLYGGTLRVEDKAVLKTHAINVTNGSNSTMRITDAEVNASGYDITVNKTGTLEIGGTDGSAKVTANNINIEEGATLSFTRTEVATENVAITLAAADSISIHNDKIAGIVSSSNLNIAGGATLKADGAHLSMDGGILSFLATTENKTNLVLTLGAEYSPNSQIILFSDVDTVKFLQDNITATSTGAMVTLNAADYFTGDWINDKTTLVYDSGNVYVSGVNVVIPEPTSATLSLLALVGFAARRRRK